jgi:ubiquinone/menaquinone biosynthesis C-methylase UbiE
MTTSKPIAAGKSSYDLIDADRFWRLMALQNTTVLLDLGCGVGNYALPAARIIGPRGVVYALDAWADGIAALRESAADRRLTMLRPVVADISEPLPLTPASVDVVLLATVVHDLIQDGRFENTMGEVGRVLAANGRLAVVEFKKIDGPPGPPRHIRLSPEALATAVRPFGFRLKTMDDIGDCHYLAQFTR